MKTSSFDTIELYLDIGETEAKAEELSGILGGLEEKVDGFANQIIRVFGSISKAVQDLTVKIGALTFSLSTIAEWDFSIASTGLIEIADALSGIITQLEEQQSQDLWTSLISSVINGAQVGVNIYSTEVERTKGKYESGRTSVFGGTEGRYTANNDYSVSGPVGSAFAGIGDFSSMLPDEAMLQSLTDMIGKLKESAAAWAAQMGAKIADKAVDLQIIALYVADYVKAFGAMVAQIAASTAAWISNTAAKVASTAAEWAQIAATTAWNALCAVATTVTTAFGAAMAFLTSPIGLVVVAITALIAIVVLLVKNWDTVKAAAISVWESIKSAFGTAAAWFNENVVQPVAGFFSGLWDGFKEAAANAWEGVKSIFSTVGGFFKEVFSRAWEKVVSVFSAAGNIFVNIKDAIVSVFKTVVNGIINGLNSIISVPFKGINGALTLVKNIEILGLQPFSGLQTISVPQIPLLARGAVLPANRPFMAIVGDQKHGTNIEAPLTTIQEAVALVMRDQTSAIMAGFNASVEVQREILSAVLGIQIGDDVIAAAYDRYSTKMAMQRGV